VVSANGTEVPMLFDSNDHCSALMLPEADGMYGYNEEHYTVWLAYQKACGGQMQGQCSNPGIERMWEAWQGRRLAPDHDFQGHPLLSMWSSYLVHLPFYLVHPFNSDPAYVDLFRSHWQADWAYYNSSALYAGERGQYGLGAGPTDPLCSGGTKYKADLITVNEPGGATCRMYSPYAVAGYLPAAPEVIKGHLLALLADGETVMSIPGTSYHVLWRKSLLERMWTQGYGITMVDFSSELFGLSTLWLGTDFYKNNTNHWPSAAPAEKPVYV